MSDEIHSIIHLENSEDNTSTLIVGTNRAGAGIIFQGTTTFIERDSGYSGQPVSMLAWHPLLDKATWVYIADSLRTRRIDVTGTNVKVGITRPNRDGSNNEYAHMQTPELTAATIDTLYDLATGDNPTANADWFSKDGDYTIEGITDTIDLQKLTRVDPGGTLNAIKLTLNTPGVKNTTQAALAGRILTVTKDWRTGFASASRAELFVKLSNLQTMNFMRISLSLEPIKTGMTYADNGSGVVRVTSTAHAYSTDDAVLITDETNEGGGDLNGYWFITVIDADTFDLVDSTFAGATSADGNMTNFSKNAYYSDITPSELSSSGDLSEELLTANQQDSSDETRLRRQFEEFKQMLVDLRLRSYRLMAERMSFQDFVLNWAGTLDEAVIASDEWFSFSRPKTSWFRSGSDPLKNWSDITAITIGALYNGLATTDDTITFAQIDMVKSESILNSKLGGQPYDWRYTYYESATGVESNPSSIMPEGIEVVQQVPTLTVVGTDITVADKIRIWRRGGFLREWHLVDTIDNPGAATTTTYVDGKDDLEIATSPILEQDNFIPLPLPVEVTQLIKFSQNFNNATWVKTNAVIESNVRRAPDFGESADEMIVSAVDGEVNQTVTTTTQETYFSVYVKANSITGSGPHIRLYNTVSAVDQETDITLAQPNFEQTEGGKAGVWERFVITCAIGTTDVGVKVITSGDAIYLWGAQLESWDALTGFLEPARYTTNLKFQEDERTTRQVVLGEDDDDTFKGSMRVEDTTTTIIEILEDGGPPEQWWGPFAQSIFAVRGNKDSNLVNAGRLYWSKAQRPDQWRPQDNIEITGAGEPLQAGFIFNTRPYVFSTEHLYAINVNPVGLPRFVAWKTPVDHGLWKRHAIAVGPGRFWWLAKDGIYESAGGTEQSITTQSFVRPIFEQITINANAGVSMEADEDEMRLQWHSPYLYFYYKDTNGDRRILRYEPELVRWEYWETADPIRMSYSEAETRSHLFGTEDGLILKQGGAADDHGTPIVGEIRTGALDQDAPNQNKTYGDIHIEASIPVGVSVTVTPFLDDEATTESGQLLVGTGARIRYKIELGRDKIARSISFGFTNITTFNGNVVVLHELDIAFQLHQISQLHWDSNFEDDGNLEDKWISGLYLECDTGGVDKDIRVDVDGVEITGSPFTINSTGVKPVKISFEPLRGVSMRFTSVAVEGSLWNWKWVWKQEPVQLEEPFDWENLGHPYEKFVKGFAITADTFGQEVDLELRINGDESTNPLGVENFTFTHNGPQTAQFAFDNSGTNQILAELVRLTNTTSFPIRVYNIQWIFDQEPPNYNAWRTQEQSFNLAAYGHIKDAWISLRSNADVILTVTIDGTILSPVETISSTGGNRRKIHVQFPANKGKNFQFTLTSAGDFLVYNEDTAVWVKPFNTDVGYKQFQLPFEGGAINP